MTEDTGIWFEQWWNELPKHHFTSYNKGSKAECLKEIEKLDPNEKLRAHITWYTKELALRTAKMKSRNIKVAGWRHAVRLIRYRFYEDDLPSIVTEQAKIASTKCQCGRDTEIVNQCWDCYQKTSVEYKKHRQHLANKAVEIGTMIREGERREDWHARCKDFCINKGFRL